MKILDIGCANMKVDKTNRLLKEFIVGNPEIIGIDKYYDADIKLDVEKERLPFADGTIDIVYASNFFENLANPFFTIDEIWRVLVGGGKFIFRSPYFRSYNAIAPFHKTFWSANSFVAYLDDDAVMRHALSPAIKIKFKLLKLEFEFSKMLRFLNYIFDSPHKRRIYEKWFSHILPATKIIFVMEKART